MTGRDSWRLLRGIVEQKERALNRRGSKSGIGVVDLDCLLETSRIVEKSIRLNYFTEVS